MQDMSAVAVVTSNEGLRGGRIIPLRKTVAETLANNQCPTVKDVFVIERTDNVAVIEPTDIRLSEALPAMSAECEPEAMGSEDLLFVLYTSGSTGTPKGIGHSTAGYLLYTAFTHKHIFRKRFHES
jgi:acetyl-CoA synthetase